MSAIVILPAHHFIHGGWGGGSIIGNKVFDFAPSLLLFSSVYLRKSFILNHLRFANMHPHICLFLLSVLVLLQG